MKYHYRGTHPLNQPGNSDIKNLYDECMFARKLIPNFKLSDNWPIINENKSNTSTL